MTRWRCIIPLVAVLVLGACGDQSARDARSPDAQVLARSIAERLDGTPEQQAALDFLVVHLQNQGLETCMARHGIAWHPPSLDHPRVRVEEPLGFTWLREPMRPVVSQAVLLEARLRAVQRHPRNERITGRKVEVLGYCLNHRQHTGISDDHLAELAPSWDTEASLAFHRLVNAATRSLPSDRVYARCMARAGTPVHSDAEDGFDSFGVAEDRLRDTRPAWRDVPLPHQRPSRAWTAFLAREHDMLLDDAACRRRVYPTAIRRLGPRLAALRRDQSPALERLAREWSAVERRAEGVGWVPLHG